MCPLSCDIVQKAIREHETIGAIMGRVVDWHKKNTERCHACTRNELSNKPMEERKEMWREPNER